MGASNRLRRRKTIAPGSPKSTDSREEGSGCLKHPALSVPPHHRPFRMYN